MTKTLMDRRLGATRGELLRRFLADMRAAETLAEVPLFQESYSETELRDEIVVDLGSGLGIRLKSNPLKPPMRSNSCIDWDRIERVMFLRIDSLNA